MIRRAIYGDVHRLATLHAAALPSSMLTLLGISALERFYRFAVQHERTWSALADDVVVGGLVLADAPETMLSRFAKTAPILFARDMANAALASRQLRGRIASRFRDGVAGEQAATDVPVHVPEVTQIFTDAAHRGRGLGAALLRACEADLAGRGVGAYFVHTERDDNAAGIRFYLREGFVEVGRSRSFGVDFLVLRKTLAA